MPGAIARSNNCIAIGAVSLALVLGHAPVYADEVDLNELFSETDPEAKQQQRESEDGEQNDQAVIALEEPTPETPEPPRQRPDRVIEEIVVTATKREESLRDIAASISALVGEELESSGLQDVDDIVDAVPGVNIVDANSGEAKRITIRGISAGGVATPATSGVFIGETPFTDAGLPRVNLDANPFDMASVEVLKGPVGTLFGGSGLNGAIRYLPQQPVMGEWQGKLFSEWRRFTEGDQGAIYGAALNLPLGRDDLALRLVGFDRTTAGYVDSTHPNYTRADANETRQDGLRAMLLWEPLDDLSLSAMYIEQTTVVDDIVATDNTEGRLVRGDTPSPSPRFSDYQLLSLTGRWDLGWAETVFNVATLDKTYDIFLDASNRASFSLDTVLGQGTVGGGTANVQELRLVSNDDGGDWDWLAGLFNYEYQVEELATLGTRLQTTAPIGSALGGLLNPGGLLPPGLVDEQGNPYAVHSTSDSSVREQAFFGELNWRFLPAFQLTLGLRLYEFDYDTLIVSEGVGSVLSDPSQPGRAELNPASTERGLNPKLSLSWDATEQIMSYLTVARGFRFGGTNTNGHPEARPTYDSDHLWNYEVGLRTTWLERTLIADAAAFYVDWKNAQVLRFTSDGVVGYNDNVGAVEGTGLEAQLTWLPPMPGLTLNGTLAYADVRTASEFEGVPAGTRWPLAPKRQTSATASWHLPLGPTLFGISLSHFYHGEARGLLEQDVKIFGYETWKLQLTLDGPERAWWPSLSLNVNNLRDKRGVTFVNIFAANVESYIPPRNVSLRLSWNF